MKGLIGVLAAASLVAAACGGAAHASTATRAGGNVTVTLGDNMKILLDKSTVTAGSVTFSVTNTGKVAHEMVVLKTDLPEGQIPADATKPGKVSEDASVGETGDMDAGTTKEVTLDLAAGKYVLICNEPGHYASGMHTTFTVK